MSRIWPCMCVGKLTCCFVSNDARISLSVIVVADGDPGEEYNRQQCTIPCAWLQHFVSVYF